MIDLCLINPNNRTPAPFAAIEPPLWLGLIAGYEKAHGKKVAVLDAEAENLTIRQTVKTVKDLNPQKTLIVCMGNNPSVSSTPKWPVTERLLLYIDAEVTGLHPIAIHYPGVIREPFQGFPTVPWDGLHKNLYRAHNWHCLDDVDKRSPYAVLYTSLNCPYHCNYCNVHTLYGDHKVRYRPLEDVFKELDYFARQGIHNIKIWDECFTLNEQRVHRICDYIIDKGYQFNMWAYTRLGSVRPIMLSKLWMAGNRWLAVGFENLNDRKVMGPLEAIQLIRECGLNIIANFMFGLPGESIDSMRASLDFAIRHNFEWVNFQVALPYPGSKWWDSLTVKHLEWSRFNQFSPTMYGNPEAIAFREHAFRTYFNRPEYLDMIAEKFGEKAKAHIQEMLKWKIK